MNDLPERLRALADSLEGDDWNHPLLSLEACREAAAEIERLRKQLFDAQQALLREGMDANRLMDRNDFLAQQVVELGHEVKRLQAENDRMRPELIRLRLLTCGGRAEKAVGPAFRLPAG